MEKDCSKKVDLWSMVVYTPRNRGRLHIAPSSFASFCGLTDLLLRDYVTLKEGRLYVIGEGGQLFGPKPDYEICKKCLSIAKNIKPSGEALGS